MNRDYVITKEFLMEWFKKFKLEELVPKQIRKFSDALDKCDLDTVFDYLVLQYELTGHIDNAFVLYLISRDELISYYETPLEFEGENNEGFEVFRKAIFNALTRVLKETRND